MAFTFHFKAGAAQSRDAGLYFSQVGNEILASGLETLEARQLVLTEDGHEPMPLRLWSAHEPTGEDLGSMVPWIREIRHELFRIATAQVEPLATHDMVQRWLTTPHATDTFFAELLDTAHAFTTDEDNTLSIGVVAGETVMLSARDVIFMKLSPDQYGLAIANEGSYLIERVPDSAQHHARRA